MGVRCTGGQKRAVPVVPLRTLLHVTTAGMMGCGVAVYQCVACNATMAWPLYTWRSGYGGAPAAKPSLSTAIGNDIGRLMVVNFMLCNPVSSWTNYKRMLYGVGCPGGETYFNDVRKELHDYCVAVLNQQLEWAREKTSSRDGAVSMDMGYAQRGAHSTHGTGVAVDFSTNLLVAAAHFSEGRRLEPFDPFGITIQYPGSAKSAEAFITGVLLHMLKLAKYDFKFGIVDGDCALHSLLQSGTLSVLSVRVHQPPPPQTPNTHSLPRIPLPRPVVHSGEAHHILWEPLLQDPVQASS